MSKILAALGVDTESDALTAIDASTKFVADVVSATGKTSPDAAVAFVRETADAAAVLASVRELVGAGDPVGTIAAWKADAEKLLAAAEARDAALAELEAIKAQAAKADHAALVTQLLDEGKLTVGMKAWAEGVSTDVLRSFGEHAAPAIPGAGKPPVQENTDIASAADEELAAKFGVPVEKIRAARAAAPAAKEND